MKFSDISQLYYRFYVTLQLWMNSINTRQADKRTQNHQNPKKTCVWCSVLTTSNDVMVTLKAIFIYLLMTTTTLFTYVIENLLINKFKKKIQGVSSTTSLWLNHRIVGISLVFKLQSSHCPYCIWTTSRLLANCWPTTGWRSNTKKKKKEEPRPVWVIKSVIRCPSYQTVQIFLVSIQTLF